MPAEWAQAIAERNALRCAGYVYDAHCGLYYPQRRQTLSHGRGGSLRVQCDQAVLDEWREVAMSLRIEIDGEHLAAFCRLRGIVRLSLFGSVLRDDFGPESDVDVLVELDPAADIGLFEFVDLRDELTALLGREVDLHTPASLSHFFRDEVTATAETAYAA